MLVAWLRFCSFPSAVEPSHLSLTPLPRICTHVRARLAAFTPGHAMCAHLRAVLKSQSLVLIIAERGEVKVVKSCARKERASAAQGTRKVTVPKGLPSFMKGGDIFLLYLCFSNVA